MKTKKCPTCGYPKSDIQYCSPKCKSDAEKEKIEERRHRELIQAIKNKQEEN